MSNNVIIPTMATIKEAAAMFPGLTEYNLRLLVKRDKCPFVYVRTGSKYLINCQSVAAWLSGGNTEGE
jgi:hypothetical protein